MTVGDHAGRQTGIAELFPNVIRMPPDHSMGAISQMRAQPSAGLDRRGNLFRVGGGMADRNHNPGPTARRMKSMAPGSSGASVTSRMRPPEIRCSFSNSFQSGGRTCSRGCAPRGPSSPADIGPFEMAAGNQPVGPALPLARLADGGKSSGEPLERIRDQRRTKSRDAEAKVLLEHAEHFVGRDARPCRTRCRRDR